MKIELLTRHLAHELDVAWIILLWLQIHGGDPAEAKNPVTVLVARALAVQMAEQSAKFSKNPGAAIESLSRLGIKVKGRVGDKKNQEIDLKTPSDLQQFGETLLAVGWGRGSGVEPSICLYTDGLYFLCHLLYAVVPPAGDE